MKKSLLAIACGYLAQANDAGQIKPFVVPDCSSIPSGDNDCGEAGKPCPIDTPPMYESGELLVMKFWQMETDVNECVFGRCQEYTVYKYYKVRQLDVSPDLVSGSYQARLSRDGIWALGYPCTGGDFKWANGFLQPTSHDFPGDKYYGSENQIGCCALTAKTNWMPDCGELAHSPLGFTGRGSIELHRLNDGPQFTYKGIVDASTATPDLTCGWETPCEIHTSSLFKIDSILRADIKNPKIGDLSCIDWSCPEYEYTMYFKVVETNIRSEWGDIFTTHSQLNFCEYYCLNEAGETQTVCVNDPLLCSYGAYEGGPEGRPKEPMWVVMDLVPAELPTGPRYTTTTSTTTTTTPTTTTTTTETFPPGAVEIPCSENIHLELVLLMDASSSFEDDKKVVEVEFPRLMVELQRQFGVGHARIGFGTFIDKPVAPFGWPSDYCSRLHQPLTDDPIAIEETIRSTPIRGGYDGPEGILEALSTFASLSSGIGYDMNTTTEDGRTIVRMLVAATDAPYHKEGDGLAIGLPAAVDKSHCQDSDYPPTSMVSAVLVASKYTPAFLVTKGAIQFYEELQADFQNGGLKSYLAELEQDSSNIFDVVFDVLLDVCKDHAPV